MSVTHPDDARISDARIARTPSDEAFVPRYARASTRKKPVRTWMILAPLGALALLGGGASLMMSSGTPTAPVEESTPVIQPRAVTPAPLESSTPVRAEGLPSNASTVITPVAPAPMVREATPASRPAPVVRQREAAPTATRTVRAPAPAARESAPAPSTGPTAYSAPTTSLNSASPSAAPSVAPTAPAPAPAPSITPSPLG